MDGSKVLTKQLWAYVVGYLLSIALTIGTFGIVWQDMTSPDAIFSRTTLIAIVIGLAVLQLFVQLVFFLHLGREEKPRRNLQALLLAVMVVLIVVFGSVWVMNNLNYHMMTPSETRQYMHNHEGI